VGLNRRRCPGLQSTSVRGSIFRRLLSRGHAHVIALKRDLHVTVAGYCEAFRRACARLKAAGTPWRYRSKTQALRLAHARRAASPGCRVGRGASARTRERAHDGTPLPRSKRHAGPQSLLRHAAPHRRSTRRRARHRHSTPAAAPACQPTVPKCVESGAAQQAELALIRARARAALARTRTAS